MKHRVKEYADLKINNQKQSKMKRQRKTSADVEQKYLKALKDLKVLIETYNGKIVLRDWRRAYKLDQYTGTVLTRNKIVVNKSTSQKFPIYKWNTIDPNVYMVNKILDEMRERRASYKSSKRKKKVSNVNKRHTITSESIDMTTWKESCEKSTLINRKPKKVKVEKCNYKTKKISIFWGLIKIEK